MFTLIPKVFYERMDDALDLFVDVLGFELGHRDGSLAVVERLGAKAYLVADAEFAARDRPELTIETDDIAAEFARIHARRPELLHPNLREITRSPWGALEFALLDATGACVVFRQFDH